MRAVVAGVEVSGPAWVVMVQILDRATLVVQILDRATLLLVLAAHISAVTLAGGRPTPDRELLFGPSAVRPELLSP